jgi:hypothetical protein
VAKFGEITLKDGDGNRYVFSIFPREAEFNSLGSVYVLSKRTRPAGAGSVTHDLIYIGQTADLSKCPLNHHKTACFDKHEANCLWVHLEPNEAKRLIIEAGLILHHKPPCND